MLIRALTAPSCSAWSTSRWNSGGTERLVARALDSPGMERIFLRAVESPGVERLVGEVMQAPGTERVVDRVVDSAAVERAVDRVIEGRLLDRVVERLLESEELWVLVDEIARSPAVTQAITQQSLGFADQVAGSVRERSRDVDGRLERIARRMVGRRARVPDPPGP